MHEKGIVHKDLKPESILLKRDPTTKKMIVLVESKIEMGFGPCLINLALLQVKLADFGFEQPNLIETRRAKMTKTITAGTPLFMVNTTSLFVYLFIKLYVCLSVHRSFHLFANQPTNYAVSCCVPFSGE